MSIDDRIAISEKRFEEERVKREHALQTAEESLTEMTKLQGEWRVLAELQDSEKKPNKQATVIDAVPEEN